QGRVIRHLGIVGLFGLDRTAGHMCRDEITRSPARIGKLVGTSSPGTSWSYGPLGAIDPGGMNLWGRISRTVTLKPHRAIGWDGASAVVEITLVGEGQAQVGHEFVYRGPQPECRPCKVRAACLNQALGQRYRIKRVRDVTHPCLLNEERARVVEVELAPPEASLPSRAAIEGAVVTLGYGPKREPFDLVAFKGLHNGKRFHMRLETHGLDRVPKGSEIDLHMDFFHEVKGFHRSEAESPEIAFEMARLLGALNDQDPERTRPRVRCPDCGKAFGQEAFRAHRKVVHGY